MAFTAKDVSNLREMTGVGMMDCKKALAASDGDIEKAIEYLREKGLAATAKKAGRIAAEGIVYATVKDNGVAAIVEVNCETDFAGKNEDFQKFVRDIADVIAEKAPDSVETLAAMTYPGTSMTIEAMRTEKVLVIGENIQIRRFERYDTGFSIAYNHMGGRIGVLVNMELSAGLESKEAVIELGKDLAMQAAAMNPQYLNKESVPGGDLEKEEQIQLAKAMEENKEKKIPEDKALQIAQNMVKGRINKFYEEFCLLEQAYVKENKISVKAHVAAVAKENGGDIKIVNFVRFEKGAGIEKKEDNFAEEVAKMIK